MKGVRIGEKHSFEDWGLTLASPPPHTFPEAKKYLTDIPGGDGQIDFTEMVCGRAVYDRRSFSISFGAVKPRREWLPFMQQFAYEYHGRERKIIYDDEPDFYYIGRLAVDTDFERVATLGKFSVKVDAEPFRYSVVSSAEPWLWKPFNFRTGVITQACEIKITADNNEIVVPRGSVSVCPEIIVEDVVTQMYVTHEGKTYSLAAGRNRIPQIRVGEKEVTLTFTGEGTVTLDYRRRVL